MNSMLTIIRHLNNKIKKRPGYAWYMGTFVLIAMLVMALLFIGQWKIELAVETIEDMTAASALGSMRINAQQYSLFKDTVFSSDPGEGVTTNASSEGRVASPDYCFETLQKLVGENLGLIRTPGTCSYSGYSTLVDTQTTPLTITKAVYYNWYVSDGFVESYTYEPAANTKGYSVTYKANEGNFPSGAMADNSGIYIEVEIPLEFLGRHTTITKGQWTAANFN